MDESLPHSRTSADLQTIVVARRRPSVRHHAVLGPDEDTVDEAMELGDDDDHAQAGEEEDVILRACPVDAQVVTPYDYVSNLHDAVSEMGADDRRQDLLPAIHFIPGLYKRCPPKAGRDVERRASLLDARTMCAILRQDT